MKEWLRPVWKALVSLNFRRAFEIAVFLIPFEQTFALKVGVRLVPSEVLLGICLMLMTFGTGRIRIRKIPLILAILLTLCIVTGEIFGAVNYQEVSQRIPEVSMEAIHDYALWLIVDGYKGLAIVVLILGMDHYMVDFASFARLTRICCTSILFVCGYGLYVYISKQHGLPLLPGTYIGATTRSASTFWEPNTFGNFATLALAMYFIYRYSILGKRIAVLGLAIIVVGGMASLSTVFAGLFLPLTLLFAIVYKDKKGIQVGLAIAIGCAIYLAMNQAVFVDIVQERLIAKLGLSGSGYVHVSTRERLASVGGAWDAIRESHGIGGLGLGAGFALFGKVSNVPIELWLDCSIVGLVAFCAIVLSTFLKPSLNLLPQRILMVSVLILISQSLGFKFSLFFYFFALWTFYLNIIPAWPEARARLEGDA